MFHNAGIGQIWVFDDSNCRNKVFDGKTFDVSKFNLDIREMFKYMGIRFVVAPNCMNAEKLCCYLAEMSII